MFTVAIHANIFASSIPRLGARVVTGGRFFLLAYFCIQDKRSCLINLYFIVLFANEGDRSLDTKLKASFLHYHFVVGQFPSSANSLHRAKRILSKITKSLQTQQSSFCRLLAIERRHPK